LTNRLPAGGPEDAGIGDGVTVGVRLSSLSLVGLGIAVELGSSADVAVGENCTVADGDGESGEFGSLESLTRLLVDPGVTLNSAITLGGSVDTDTAVAGPTTPEANAMTIETVNIIPIASIKIVR
jgi:hypothetical protein